MATTFEIPSNVWNKLKDHLVWKESMPSDSESDDLLLEFRPGDRFFENSIEYQNNLICRYMPEVCKFFDNNEYCWNLFKLDLDNNQIIGSVFNNEDDIVENVFVLTTKLSS